MATSKQIVLFALSLVFLYFAISNHENLSSYGGISTPPKGIIMLTSSNKPTGYGMASAGFAIASAISMLGVAIIEAAKFKNQS